MSILYPGAIDGTAQLPQPNTTDKTNSPSHAAAHDNESLAIIALETKLGTGASTASSGTVLRGTGSGTSAYGAIQSGDVNASTGSGSFVLATSPTITGLTTTSPKILTSINDTNNNEFISFTSTASAVNQINITNAATNNTPVISAAGNDTDISINIVAKGAGEVQHNGQMVPPTGAILPFAGFVAPTYWLFCDGSTVSRTTYANLFAVISPVLGTFTVTINAPAIVTLNNHNLQTGDQLYLTTNGSLPTGLTANTLYYAVRINANTFNLATSRANAYAGTKITTTGSQSGTHTLTFCPYGLGDGSTTFNLPDTRGRALAGNDSMGGTVASRLTAPSTTGSIYGNMGASGGEQAHSQTSGELAIHNHADAGHTHGEQVATGSVSGTGITGTANLVGNTPANQSTQTGFASINNAGSGTAANVVQPTLVMNYIIKI